MKVSGHQAASALIKRYPYDHPLLETMNDQESDDDDMPPLVRRSIMLAPALCEVPADGWESHLGAADEALGGAV